LASIVIPESVTSIGARAFQNSANLSDVIIHNSGLHIGLNAFAGTPWLNNQPDEIEQIVLGDFDECEEYYENGCTCDGYEICDVCLEWWENHVFPPICDNCGGSSHLCSGCNEGRCYCLCGIPVGSRVCGDCEQCDCDCQNCSDCGHIGGRFGFGLVRGGDNARPQVNDALQILRFLVGLPSPFDASNADSADALAAANITRAGQSVTRPQVQDALQILRFLVGLPTYNSWCIRYR
jgi:hypothetical protein